MSANKWFNLFCQMNPPGFGCQTFHNVKYFNLQMNNIVQMSLVAGLSKRVTRHPTYTVTYTLRDAEVVDSSTTESNIGE